MVHWVPARAVINDTPSPASAVIAEIGITRQRNDYRKTGDPQERADPTSKCTIPFGHPPLTKTTRISETHFANVKTMPCSAKRKLGLARAGKNGNRDPQEQGKTETAQLARAGGNDTRQTRKSRNCRLMEIPEGMPVCSLWGPRDGNNPGRGCTSTCCGLHTDSVNPLTGIFEHTGTPSATDIYPLTGKRTDTQNRPANAPFRLASLP